MADNTVPATQCVAKPEELANVQPPVTIPFFRAGLCFDAAAEISALTGVIEREWELDNSSVEYQYLLKTVLHRMRDLASVVLSVHGGDDDRQTGEMYEVVRHEKAPDYVSLEIKASAELAA